MYRNKKITGFTLIEILIVIAIVGILSSIVITSMSQARQNSRDKARIIDISQLGLTFRLYMEANGSYPAGYDEGAEISTVNEIMSLGPVPVDPVNNATYHYIYDGSYSCDGTDRHVVYATELESLSKANEDELCGTTGSSKFMVVLR